MSVHNELAGLGGHGERERALQAGPHRDLARLVGRYPDGHHAVRIGNENLAGYDRIAVAIGDFGYAGLHVQFAAVIDRLLGASEREDQVAQRLVTLLRRGNAPEVRVGHLLGFLKLAREDQVANYWKVRNGLGVVIVVGTPGPETALVERDPFLPHAAEDHRAHDAIAQRHGLVPARGRLAIPEDHVSLQIGLSRRRSQGQRGRQQQQCGNVQFHRQIEAQKRRLVLLSNAKFCAKNASPLASGKARKTGRRGKSKFVIRIARAVRGPMYRSRESPVERQRKAYLCELTAAAAGEYQLTF